MTFLSSLWTIVLFLAHGLCLPTRESNSSKIPSSGSNPIFSHVFTILSIAALKAKSLQTKATFHFLRAFNCCTFQDLKWASINCNVVDLIYHQLMCCPPEWQRWNVSDSAAPWVFFPLCMACVSGITCLCATNSSDIAEINRILFLRLFSEFPHDISVTPWEWREKKEGISIYMLHIPTGAHLSASGKLYQLENLKLDFALVSPEAEVPAVPKRRVWCPLCRARQPSLCCRSWGGPGKDSRDGAALSERCEKRDWVELWGVCSGWGTILAHRECVCSLKLSLCKCSLMKHCFGSIVMELNFYFIFVVIICRSHGSIC